jgi:hypothetical protein
MPTYETLDTIADVYTPVLAVASLAFIATSLVKTKWRLARSQLLLLGAFLAIAYGLMFLDNRFGLWGTLGLDYSTHTAVAVVLSAFLIAIRPQLTWPVVCSLFAYLSLMLYQRYHTVLDIVSTALVVGIPTWLIVAHHCRRWPFAAADNRLE